jgi:hypothetical protein
MGACVMRSVRECGLDRNLHTQFHRIASTSTESQIGEYVAVVASVDAFLSPTT